MTTFLNIIGRFTFNMDGFSVTYAYKGQTITFTLCPGALCDLLKETGLIFSFCPAKDRDCKNIFQYLNRHIKAGFAITPYN